MIIYEAPQGSEEWHRARVGRATASMFKTARSKLKKDSAPTEAAKNYGFKVAFESLTQIPMDEGFETWQMRRGNELEPDARNRYEIRTGNTVDLAGFITTDCGAYGCSADGLVGEDGGIEIKCLVSPEKIRTALLDHDITDWYDQVQGGLWITERKWWDFIIYCPALEPLGRELTIWRIDRDEQYIRDLEHDLLDFMALVDLYKMKLRTNR